MDVPQSNPLAGFNRADDYEAAYEAKIINYLLARYKVPKHIKDQLYTRAAETCGARRLSMELVEQEVKLPLILRPRSIIKPNEKLTLPSVLNGKAIVGYLGKCYRDIRDSFPDQIEERVVIAMCFGYPYLKRRMSAASLVLHDGTPTLDEIAETTGIILCQGDAEMEIWVIEPLGQLLDRLDAELDYDG